MMWVGVFLLLLSVRIEALAAQIKLFPETLTVLRGDEARFTCSALHPHWTVMLWLLNGTAALTISRQHGPLPPAAPNSNVTAEPTSKADSWVFVLKYAQRSHQGPVTCDLQGIERKSANLFVQERGVVKVSGENQLAFRGQWVLFECRAEGWNPEPRLQWWVDTKKVSPSEYNVSTVQSGQSLLFTVTSSLNVTAARSSSVDCEASVSALTVPLRSTVRLTVVAEVVQEGGDDCTLPVAVAASIAALLLLLLLSVAAVLCYRNRTPQQNPYPQETIWIDKTAIGTSSAAEATSGKVNLGYAGEGHADADYNELIMEIRRKLDFASFHEVPDVVNSRTQSLHSDSIVQAGPSEENPTNARRITTV